MDRARFDRMLARRASRRRFLAASAGAAGLVAVSRPGRPTRSAWLQATPAGSPTANPTFAANPFALGVASGDPLPDGVVLWTRLAPDPLDGGGLDGQGAIAVRWEIAADSTFSRIVQTGDATASPDLGHSVHVDAQGLEPGREYFYRFMAGSEVSPVGRTKTAPAPEASINRLRFAFASCQEWQTGFYTAYRHMAQEDLDLVLFLGDYIYEDAHGESDSPAIVRRDTSPLTETLEDYRRRHALYKLDPDLQAAHAAFPWIATWDDHEVDNDYANDRDQDDTPTDQFLARRANAYQAFYEHLPLRPESMPQGPDMRLYRRFTYGDLAEFQVLDTRQYRTDHPCGEGELARCAAAVDPATTMTGPEQEQWLLSGLDASTARWNVIGQQVLMAELLHAEEPEPIYWQDAWDGYPAARNRILSHLSSRGISNPMVLTGDWHSTFVNDLHADFEDESSPVIGTEFVVTAITTGGDNNGYEAYYRPMIGLNPHIKLFDGDRRGYIRCDVTPSTWRADIKMVATVRDRDAGIGTFASFVVEDGQPGAQPA